MAADTHRSGFWIKDLGISVYGVEETAEGHAIPQGESADQAAKRMWNTDIEEWVRKRLERELRSSQK